VLALDEHDDAEEALSFNFADEIVELVILSTDEVFLQTLREAMGNARRLWHVLSADKVSDLLIAGQVGILVLDVQTLQDDPGVFVEQIKRQFPDLVIVAAGGREAETALANLISAGSVYRFIHKPMSPGRAKLFAEAAVRKHGEQQRRSAPAHAKTGLMTAKRGLLATATAAGLAAVVVTAWTLRREPARAPIAEESPSSGMAAASATGSTPDPRDEAHEDLLARAEHAVLAGRLEEAAAAIAAAKRAGVDSGHLAFLNSQLAKARAAGKQPAPEAGRHDSPSSAQSSSDRLAENLSLAAERMLEGQLIDPERDNARWFVQQALLIDPHDAAALEAEQSLSMALLSQAHAAIGRRDFARAAVVIEAADGVASPTNIENLRQLLEQARVTSRPAESATGASAPAAAHD
jgi:hypothetical protein